MTSYPNPCSLSSSQAISTGSAAVDGLLGCGGLPRGRIVEVFGPPGCGKTTLSLAWIAAAQRQGANVVFVDVERSLDSAWAARCDVRLEDLVVLSPANADEALAMTESLLRSFGVDLVVVDSAAALVSAGELDTTIGQTAPAQHTEVLFRCLRRLNMLALRSSACVLILNQERGEEGRWSSGNRALALQAAVRVSVSPEHGGRLRLCTRKNKMAGAFAEAVVALDGPRVADIVAPGREPVRIGMAAVAGSRRAG